MIFRRKQLAVSDDAPGEEKPAVPPTLSVVEAPDTRLIDLKVRVHQRLIDELNLPVIERMERTEIEPQVGPIIRDMLRHETVKLSTEETKQFVSDVLDELLGFGALEPLLKDATVNDIIVNTSHSVCVERRGDRGDQCPLQGRGASSPHY